MKQVLQKIRDIFNGPALRAIVQWSRPVHGAILLISVIGVVMSLLSLAVTLVTKALVDGATGGNEAALWKFGVLMVALFAVQRGLSVCTSYIQIKASAKL